MSHDDYLLAALRMAAGNDPVPSHVSAAARDAYALRVPHAVTATPVEGTVSGGVRDAGGPRLIRFSANDLAFDLEVSIGDGLIDIAGQVVPPPGEGSHVDIRTPHLTLTRRVAHTGQFAATGLPPGWLSVVCHRPGQPPVQTRWVRIRP